MMLTENHVDAEKASGNLSEHESFLRMHNNQRTNDSAIMLNNLSTVLKSKRYRTLAIYSRVFYYFFIFSHVGFSLIFGGIPLKSRGY